MSIAFAGSELEAFSITGGAPTEDTAQTLGWDSTYNRCSIRLQNGDQFQTPALGALTTAWTHFEIYNPFGNNSQTLVQWYNNAGTAVFQIVSSGGAWQMQYWNGSSFTNIGSPVTMNTSSRDRMDIKIVCGASGSAEFYLGNSLKTSGSASMTSVTDIDRVRFRDTVGGLTWYVSQIIVATTSTVGWKMYTKPPTGNSATNTAFTGAFGDVDETVTSDVDFITSTAANDVETYTGAAISIPSTVRVKAVVVTMRAKNDASAPTNVQGALRIGSTNYFSSNLSAINSGFGPLCAVWETDPSTAAAWGATNAGAATTEFGAKSIT